MAETHRWGDDEQAMREADAKMTDRGGRSGRSLIGDIVQILPPAALTAALVIVAVYDRELVDFLGITVSGDLGTGLIQLVETLAWFTAAYTVQRALRILFWEDWVSVRRGVPVPRLLIDMTGVAIYLATLTTVLAQVFGFSVTGLLTTSSIMIAVIGFALRNMISDVFTGVALGAEQPFTIGDWIELEDGTVGIVRQMNWRATSIVTRDEIMVVIPNSQLATRHFRNFSTPERFFRDETTVVLDYGVPALRAERLLLSAVWQVDEIMAVPRKPEVRIDGFQENGVRWLLRYWLPDYNHLWRLRYEVRRRILSNLRYSGVQVPGERIDIRNLGRKAEAQDIDFLHNVDLFAALNEDDFKEINDKMERRFFHKGEAVVRQGEPGQSLFVLREGLMNVFVTGEDENQTRVGQLGAGAFFGEMSLLTGAPRRATVIPEVDSIGFKITKETLEPILQRRPELIEQLSEALAERKLTTEQVLSSEDRRETQDQKASMTRDFVRSIRQFFDLHLHH